jgi:hypothetical protein
MKKSIRFAVWSVAALTCATSLAASPERAQVVLKKPSGPGAQEATFLLGARDNYAISCFKGDECMAMPAPTATGWYCGGFLNITVNGQEARTNLASMFEAEQENRAVLDSAWHLAAADVRVRFLGMPGRDFLFCEMTIEPREEMKSIELTTLCYPAYFTSFYGQREQARFVLTPSQLLREAEGRKNIQLAPKENWWLVYGDEYFDVAKTRESEGPCAMLILPEDVASITVRGLGYDVTTTVTVGPATRKIRMAFWKMKGRTNAEAAEYFRTNGEAIRKELAVLDFTPAPLKTFDLAGITAEIERVARSEAVGAEFQKKASEILAWIKAGSADLAAGGDGISATERKLELLRTYNSFVYEARLAELLASLDKN